jgi:hypothetical protein
MRAGIRGSGLMGGKLGTIFARAGQDVVFSYARSQSKLQGLAREARGKARAGTPREVLFGVFDARSKAKRPSSRVLRRRLGRQRGCGYPHPRCRVRSGGPRPTTDR